MLNPLSGLRRKVYLPYARIPQGRMVELPGRGSTYVTDTPGPPPSPPRSCCCTRWAAPGC